MYALSRNEEKIDRLNTFFKSYNYPRSLRNKYAIEPYSLTLPEWAELIRSREGVVEELEEVKKRKSDEEMEGDRLVKKWRLD